MIKPLFARRRRCLYALVLALSWLSGCTTLTPPRAAFEDPLLQTCADTYAALNRVVDRAGVRDAAFHRLPGFPYLRSSRFLGSFASLDPDDPEPVVQWLQRMNRLAVEGLLLESQQLPPAAALPLPPASLVELAGPGLEGQLHYCGRRLTADISRRPELVRAIAGRAQPADHYQVWKRWLGLYPLTALPFRRGVVKEHRHIKGLEQEHFRAGGQGRFNRYVPARGGDTERALASLRGAPRDRLGIPLLTAEQRAQLLAAWSPRWQVEAGDDNDRIGEILWADDGRIELNPNSPKVYTFVTYGRYRGQVTVQLNYSVWFSERLPKNRWDLLAGKLDGLIWRVHLLPDGQVLAADSIHNCGCWYQLYPAPAFTAEVVDRLYREPVFIGTSGHIDFERPVVLTLQANSHLLLAVENSGSEPWHGNSHRLRAVSYNVLRSLPSPEGVRRSLFAENGLVEASRRGERWLFWPMGVASPGAMRVIGTHAIAFIGRRHFDDPALLDLLKPVNNIGATGQ